MKEIKIFFESKECKKHIYDCIVDVIRLFWYEKHNKTK